MNAYEYVNKIGFQEANRVLSSLKFEADFIEAEGQQFPFDEFKLAAADFTLVGNSYWASIPDYIAVNHQNMMTEDYIATAHRIEIALGIVPEKQQYLPNTAQRHASDPIKIKNQSMDSIFP